MPRGKGWRVFTNEQDEKYMSVAYPPALGNVNM